MINFSPPVCSTSPVLHHTNQYSEQEAKTQIPSPGSQPHEQATHPPNLAPTAYDQNSMTAVPRTPRTPSTQRPKTYTTATHLRHQVHPQTHLSPSPTPPPIPIPLPPPTSLTLSFPLTRPISPSLPPITHATTPATAPTPAPKNALHPSRSQSRSPLAGNGASRRWLAPERNFPIGEGGGAVFWDGAGEVVRDWGVGCFGRRLGGGRGEGMWSWRREMVV